MAVTAAASQNPRSLRVVAASRRFIRWLTSARVVLSLIMLVLMFYMVIIPLYRMVETTVTWQAHDLTRVPDAEVGNFTLFHWDQDVDRHLRENFRIPRCSIRWSSHLEPPCWRC